MKTELTTEQSQHLIKLGVPECFASYIDYRKNSIFTLENLLKRLPKMVGDSTLDIQVLVDGRWSAMYYGYHPSNKIAEELIDSLYELTIWCIETGRLKFD